MTTQSESSRISPLAARYVGARSGTTEPARPICGGHTRPLKWCASADGASRRARKWRASPYCGVRRPRLRRVRTERDGRERERERERERDREREREKDNEGNGYPN